jgi:hypothetical protein
MYYFDLLIEGKRGKAVGNKVSKAFYRTVVHKHFTVLKKCSKVDKSNVLYWVFVSFFLI